VVAVAAAGERRQRPHVADGDGERHGAADDGDGARGAEEVVGVDARRRCVRGAPRIERRDAGEAAAE
jgi:hypothetical protein